MFSLLVTLISIALVAALSIATMGYIADVWSERKLVLQTATVRNQAQQISGAMELYRMDHGVWPADLATLVSGGYLKDLPLPPTLLSEAPSVLEPFVASAVAQSSAPQWEMPVSGRPHFWIYRHLNPRACGLVNTRWRSNNAVYERVDPRLIEQCFGTGRPYTYIYTLDEGSLQSDLPTSPNDPDNQIAFPTPGGYNPIVEAPTTGDLSAGTTASGTLFISPDAYTFPAQSVGTTQQQIFTVSNDMFASGASTISSVSFSGSAQIAIVSGSDNCTGATLAPGENCSVTLALTGSVAGSAPSGTLTFADGESNPTVTVQGTVNGVAMLDVTPSAHAFGAQPVSSTTDQVFTLSNNASASAVGTVSSVSYSGDGQFSILNDNCSGNSVAIGSSCAVTVRFAAATVSSAPTGTVTFNTGSGVFTVALSGTVIAAPGGQAYTTPGTYTFTVPSGVTSISMVAIGGGGDSPLYFSGPRRSGAGGGGALAYLNAYSVTPGQTLTVQVGAGGAGDTASGQAGGASYVRNGATTLIQAGGGEGGGSSGGAGGTASGISGYVGYAGGRGGDLNQVGTQGAGSGGTGGQPGPFISSSQGEGGGGGGAGGYGVAGGSGLGGPGSATSGTGGGGGGTGIYGSSVAGASALHSAGALYGGGGGARSTLIRGTGVPGGSGAVRIIWGTGKSFPSNAL